MAIHHSKTIPNFIKARTPRGLRLLMIKNNARRYARFDYFNIQFSKGSWYAWYYDNEITEEDFKDDNV